MAWIGYMAAAMSTAALAPQVRKCWLTGSARDLSGMTLGMMSAGAALWLVYGAGRDAAPLLLTNGASFTLVNLLVALKLRELRPRRPALLRTRRNGPEAEGAVVLRFPAARRGRAGGAPEPRRKAA